MGNVSSGHLARTVETPSWLAGIGPLARETRALGKLRTASHDGASVSSRASGARVGPLHSLHACAGARSGRRFRGPSRAAKRSQNGRPTQRQPGPSFLPGPAFPPSPESPPRGRAPKGPSGGLHTLEASGVNAEKRSVAAIRPTERLTPALRCGRNKHGPAERRIRPGQRTQCDGKRARTESAGQMDRRNARVFGGFRRRPEGGACLAA
jgi:hypothetical protein